jgi:hypothetical protein
MAFANHLSLAAADRCHKEKRGARGRPEGWVMVGCLQGKTMEESQKMVEKWLTTLTKMKSWLPLPTRGSARAIVNHKALFGLTFAPR